MEAARIDNVVSLVIGRVHKGQYKKKEDLRNEIRELIPSRLANRCRQHKLEDLKKKIDALAGGKFDPYNMAEENTMRVAMEESFKGLAEICLKANEMNRRAEKDLKKLCTAKQFEEIKKNLGEAQTSMELNTG